MKINRLHRCLFISILFSMLSCGPKHPVPPDPKFPYTSQYDYDVYWQWNELFKKLDRHAKGYRPCPSPRALAYLGLSAYESVVPGMPFHKSLAPLYPGLVLPQADANYEYYWPACVNESYAYLLENFFIYLKTSSNPTAVATYDQIAVLRNVLHGQYAEGDIELGVLKRSEKFGQDIATVVYNWSKSDPIGHNIFLDPQPYSIPFNHPGDWQQTPPDFGNGFFPQFGQVRTFAIAEEELICAPPVPYSALSSSPYFAQALEVFNTVNYINNPPPNDPGLAYEQHWISEFWSDDHLSLTFSMGTRWISIADQMVAKEGLNLAVCAELYAKLGLTLNDAAVAAWKSKYHYFVQRPISYIQDELADTYPQAATWTTRMNNPILGINGMSPAYPAYPSAHGSFGGGSARILSSFLENTPAHPADYPFTDFSHEIEINFLGMPRTYASITQMGEECAFSRVPLGVNYRMDCEAGLQLGRLCAQRVLELPWKK